MSLFADDTKIISLHTTLNSIYKQLKTRKLDLNLNRCNVLTFKKNKPLDPIYLSINNTKIPKFQVFKNLGIYIYI